MSDPLKIMDEIEVHDEYAIRFMVARDEWQRLRTAIEAQAEELTQVKKAWETTSEYAKGAGEIIALLQARIGRLEQALSKARDALYEYGQEQSRLDKSSAIAVADICTARLAESDKQSSAAVKVEALREAADEMQGLKWRQNFTPADWLRQRIARIESEAKEPNGERP